MSTARDRYLQFSAEELERIGAKGPDQPGGDGSWHAVMARSGRLGAAMTEREGFTPQEWRTLQFAPFWMLSAVVGAYRNIDPREYAAFTRCLGTAAATARGELSRAVLASVLAELDELTEAYGSGTPTIADGLVAVDGLLSRVPPAEAMMFKGVLIGEIGEGVARARGRFGTEVSEEDAKRLVLAEVFLGIEPVGA
jgi:hypothetical protein